MLRVGETYRNYNFFPKRIVERQGDQFIDHEGRRYNARGHVYINGVELADAAYTKNLDLGE